MQKIDMIVIDDNEAYKVGENGITSFSRSMSEDGVMYVHAFVGTVMVASFAQRNLMGVYYELEKENTIN